jgi:ABC-type transport system involved in multi-copper enzyme maturation permease subunit
MISVACSAYFQRTSASLVVSYLLILPLAILGVILWMNLADQGLFRLMLILTVLPAVAAALCIALFFNTSALLLHPPDVGSEGKEVVDLEQEAQQAVGLVIQRDQFPDKLFAPPKRDDLMEDDANPVYDKEIRSEIFSQGTLMLRLVIQVSMLLAIPFMAVCLYIWPENAKWYICYVVMFNMLVGPVFSAGSVTSERERETLDLLLTTVITPWQILWGKLIAGLRVSSVLTLFLVWPVLLACVMVSVYWTNLLSVVAYLSIVLITCLTTAMIALFCSVLFKKTAHALMTTYLAIMLLFAAPLAVRFFADTFYPYETAKPNENRATLMIANASFTSPFAAAQAVPLDTGPSESSGRSAGSSAAEQAALVGNWPLYFAYIGFSLGLDAILLLTMMWLFNTRWRVAG